MEFLVNMEAGHMLHCPIPSWKSVKPSPQETFTVRKSLETTHESIHTLIPNEKNMFHGSNQPSKSWQNKKSPHENDPQSFHLPHPHRFRHTPVLQPRDCRNHGRHSLRSEQSLGVYLVPPVRQELPK